jgi:hypothetical protein
MITYTEETAMTSSMGRAHGIISKVIRGMMSCSAEPGSTFLWGEPATIFWKEVPKATLWMAD